MQIVQFRSSGTFMEGELDAIGNHDGSMKWMPKIVAIHFDKSRCMSKTSTLVALIYVEITGLITMQLLRHIFFLLVF